MYIVLMAGGVGSRFWPRSRSQFPKQMLNLTGERSMLQLTYERIKSLTADDKILVITNEDLVEQVKEQLPSLPSKNIIAEPFGRNTAPCIGLAGAIIQNREADDEIMAVLPADHLIENSEHFRNILKIAADYAEKKKCLMTIGIKPTYPETGYGYIQRGKQVAVSESKNIYEVRTFAEKPDREIAAEFLKSGDFLWNSGMFIWSTKAIMAEFEEHQESMFEGFAEICEAVDTPKMHEVITDIYSKIPSISIDYAIMEVAKHVCIIEADFKWNDLGSWEAAYNISEKDRDGNVVNSKETVLIDAKNNFIFSEKKMVAAVDVEDLVIVETEDALLICRKDKSQKVKDIVEVLKRKKLQSYL